MYFCKVMPILVMSVGAEILEPGQKIAFGSLPILKISCISINSLPKVQMKISNPDTNITLFTSRTNHNSNTDQECDTHVCRGRISVDLTPGYAYWNNLTSVVCTATSLNSIVSTEIFIDFNSKIII